MLGIKHVGTPQNQRTLIMWNVLCYRSRAEGGLRITHWLCLGMPGIKSRALNHTRWALSLPQSSRAEEDTYHFYSRFTGQGRIRDLVSREEVRFWSCAQKVGVLGNSLMMTIEVKPSSSVDLTRLPSAITRRWKVRLTGQTCPIYGPQTNTTFVSALDTKAVNSCL